jgi:hypothetical protein
MNFVTGHPRGGTHFVSHLLNMGGGAVAIHEHLHSLTGFDILALARAYYEGRADGAAVREMVKMYRLRPQVPIDCNFLLAWLLPAILEEHRDAKILHLVRDPRPNIRSCFNFLDCYGSFFEELETRGRFIRWTVTSNKAWLYLVMREINRFMPDIRGVAHWGALSRFEKNCHFWAEAHRLILAHAAPRASAGKYMRVRLEDLGASTDAMLAVFDFLEQRPPPLERLQRLTSSRINSHNDALWSAITRIKHETASELLPEAHSWTEEMQQVSTRICGDVARQLGYAL